MDQPTRQTRIRIHCMKGDQFGEERVRTALAEAGTPQGKKRGGDGHITSPTSDRRVKTLGDQESSKEILARTDHRKHDRKKLNLTTHYQHVTLKLSRFRDSNEKNLPWADPPI